MKVLITTIFCVAIVHAENLTDLDTTSWEQVVERKVYNLFTKYKNIEKQLGYQKQQNEELERTVATQKRFIEELSAHVKANEKSAKDEARKVSRYGRQEKEKIAFSAYLDREIDSLTAEQIVPFGAVELNEGGAYYNWTGVFTTPINGVYMFTFSVEDYRGHRIWLKLVVDGQLKASVVEWSGPSQNAQGSNTVFLRLRAGQRVWVAVDARESGDSLQGWADLRTTTFSGAYMFP